MAELEAKAGDYTVQVHLIELRDLHASDEGGTSDPFVEVLLGTPDGIKGKSRSKQKHKVTSVVIEEHHNFSLQNLTHDELEELEVNISVYDQDTFGTQLIGKFLIPALSVYSMNEHHELWRQWTALVDLEDLDDGRVHGYVRLSITGNVLEISMRCKSSYSALRIAQCSGLATSRQIMRPTRRRQMPGQREWH